MKQSLRNLVLALIIGLGLFGLTSILTFGIPFSFDYPHYQVFCHFADCNTYEPLWVGMDCLFWVGIAFILISMADRVSGKWEDEPSLRYDEPAKVRFLVALLFFGSAILSLWLGFSNPQEGFSGWFIGAIVFAISGIIVFKLPLAVHGTYGNDRGR